VGLVQITSGCGRLPRNSVKPTDGRCGRESKPRDALGPLVQVPANCFHPPSLTCLLRRSISAGRPYCRSTKAGRRPSSRLPDQPVPCRCGPPPYPPYCGMYFAESATNRALAAWERNRNLAPSISWLISGEPDRALAASKYSMASLPFKAKPAALREIGGPGLVGWCWA